MAILTLSPFVKFSEYDGNGDPCSGYKLFTYQAGTAIKQATYTDVGGLSANTNPIILDAAGQATIFLLNNSSYKYVLAPPDDTDPPTSPIWTQDDINSTQASSGNTDVEGTAGENLTAGDMCYVSQGDGGLTPGSWYRCDSDVSYSTLGAIVIGFAVNTVSGGSTNVFRMSGLMTGLAGLVAGTTYFASATPGALSTTGGTYPRKAGVAASATALNIAPGENAATTTLAGNVSTVTQDFFGQKRFSSINRHSGSDTVNYYHVDSSEDGDWTLQTTSSSATPTTLQSFTLPVGFFNYFSKSCKCIFFGKYAATGNNKTTIVQIGGTTVYTKTTATNDGTWYVEVDLGRTTVTNIRCIVRHWISPTDVNSSTAGTASIDQTGFDTLAVSDLTANTLVVALVANDATAAGGTTSMGGYLLVHG